VVNCVTDASFVDYHIKKDHSLMVLEQLVLIFHILFAIILICLVLLQQGQGASTGSSFGAGASQTVFGSRGSGSFLLKFTFCLAILFLATSLVLTSLSHRMIRNRYRQSSSMIDPKIKPSTVNPKLPSQTKPVSSGKSVT